MIRKNDGSVLITAEDFQQGVGDSKYTGFGSILGDIFSEPGVLRNGGALTEDTGVELTTTILSAAYDTSQATHTSYWAYLNSTSSYVIKRVGNGLVGTWTLVRDSVPYVISKMLIFNGFLYYAGPTLLGRFQLSHSVTMTIASPCVVTYTAHGMIAGSSFRFKTTGALPTGVSAETTYYVISTGLTADSFQFSATPGGAAVNSSGTQSGTHTIWEDGWRTLNSGAHDMIVQESTLFIGNGGYIATVDTSSAWNGTALDIQNGFSVLYLAPYDTGIVYSASGINAFEGTQALTAQWDTVSESWDAPDFFSANTHHGWVKGGDVLYYVSGFNPIRISYYDGARLIPIKEIQL